MLHGASRQRRRAPDDEAAVWSTPCGSFNRGSRNSALRIRTFHIADNGLPAIIDVDVLDANILMAAVT
jgi:hypothetical protein